MCLQYDFLPAFQDWKSWRGGRESWFEDFFLSSEYFLPDFLNSLSDLIVLKLVYKLPKSWKYNKSLKANQQSLTSRMHYIDQVSHPFFDTANVFYVWRISESQRVKFLVPTVRSIKIRFFNIAHLLEGLVDVKFVNWKLCVWMYLIIYFSFLEWNHL